MKKLIAANWKMYKTRAEAAAAARELAQSAALPADAEVAVFPPFTALDVVAEAFAGLTGFSVGGQDVYPAAEGAFTGEISPSMLRDAGCNWVLCGHSERRHVLGESDEFVGRKAAFALEAGLKVTLCVGETLPQREAGELEAVLRRQLKSGFAGIGAGAGGDNIAVAYEPVWAIGTGKVAGPAEIEEAHAIVRACLEEIFPAAGAQVRILYGGSVKPENAAEIKGLKNVDGLLVGGASLAAASFCKIIAA